MKSSIHKIDILPSRVLSKRLGARFVYFDREKGKWRYQRIKTRIGEYYYLTSFLLSHLIEAYCVKNGCYSDGFMYTICNYCKSLGGFIDYEEGIPFVVTKKCAVAKIVGINDKGAYK